MTRPPAEIEAVLADLAATPGRLAALSVGLTEAQLCFKPAGEPWSASDVLAHLRACAEVWGKSIGAMLQQPHPTLRYVSPRAWMRKSDYAALAFSVSLPAFARQRDELWQLLRALPIPDWSRGATFTAVTQGREQTVLSYAQRIAQHEREHLEQIETLLKVC